MVQAQAQLTPVWTYSSGSEGWLARRVALGSHGTQGWLQFGPFVDRTRLLSGTDTAPVLPVWEHSDTQTTFNHRVAAAEQSDVLVTLHSQPVPAGSGLHNVLLRRYNAGSSTPLWSYTFPITTNGSDKLEVLVSRDGTRIAAVVHNMTNGRADVAVFQPSSSTPLRYGSIQTYMPFMYTDISADGSRLSLASSSWVGIVNLGTMTVEWGNLLFEQITRAHALSADGNVLAYGSMVGLRVYRRTAPGTYTLVCTRVAPPPAACNAVDLSEDGSTMAAAWVVPDAYLTVITELYDLPATLDLGQAVVLQTHSVTGSGTLQNSVTEIETSSDGALAVVGTWGDQAGLAPEVLVYRRGDAGLAASYNLPGSVQDLDLSANGLHLIVASKVQHNNVFGSGSRVDMFDLGLGDIRVHGAPRIGETVDIEVRGNPGQLATLLSSESLAAEPFPFARMGLLRLTPGTIDVLDSTNCDGTGSARFSYPIPFSSALIGRTLHFQGFKTGPRRLTRDWVTMSILP
jgi:hypothetical protein